jgi:regulator of protease activity HflC (stomatin/prohibitin superfamily)
MNEASVYCMGILGLLLFIGTILFAVSFDTLTPLEFGILYNDIAKEIDEGGSPYYNGRYFTGLGSSFIKYSSTWNEMTFDYGDIRAWTKEGQLVYVDLIFFWEHDRENIVDFYYSYGDSASKYTDIFRDVAQRAVKKVTTSYEAAEFFTKRQQISAEMRVALRDTFREQGVLVQLFGMQSIDLPDAFEDKVNEKVVTAQEVKTQEWLKEIDVAYAEIDVITGEGDAWIQYKLADAEATAAEIISNAKAEGQARIRDSERRVYKEMQDALGFAPEQMLKLRWSRVMETMQNNYEDRSLKFAIGFDSPIVNL